MSLDTVRDREKLKPRREPYWQKLAKGHYLGFRPSSAGKSGTWIARFYNPDTRKKEIRALGDFGHLPASDRFSAASKEAREWFNHLSGGGEADVLTVMEACQRYAAERPSEAPHLARYVYTDPIAKVKLTKLTQRHVSEWRKRLTAVEGLSTASINRYMVPLRAALNKAMDDGFVLTNRAWRTVMTPASTSKQRNLYLDKAQRRDLLKAMPDDLAALCRGLCLLPLRPGALAAMRVRDFDARTGELIVERDKANKGRKIILPAETAALFKAQSKDKLPGAALFTRADGKPWNKDAWKGPIKEAANDAGLPAETTAYTLRHSTITDLVTSGLDLLTVAQVSGTSVRMIERHYGHLQREHAKQALAKLAL